MHSEPRSSVIHYFPEEGKLNLEQTINFIYERAKELDIKKVIIFSGDGEGPTRAVERFRGTPMTIIAATFPYKMPFYIEDESGTRQKRFARLSEQEIRQSLLKQGVEIIQGTMPFQDIFIPGVRDTKLLTIYETLGLFSGGMQLCVQAIIMATEAGKVEPGEIVIAASADTAIVAQASLKSFLFHPDEGMEIKEIICKPNNLTVARPHQAR
jgi:hypothetical protein